MNDRLCRPAAIHLRTKVDIDMKWHRFRARQSPAGLVQGDVIAHHDARPEDWGIDRDVRPVSTDEYDIGQHKRVLFLCSQDPGGEDGGQELAWQALDRSLEAHGLFEASFESLPLVHKRGHLGFDSGERLAEICDRGLRCGAIAWMAQLGRQGVIGGDVARDSCP